MIFFHALVDFQSVCSRGVFSMIWFHFMNCIFQFTVFVMTAKKYSEYFGSTITKFFSSIYEYKAEACEKTITNVYWLNQMKMHLLSSSLANARKQKMYSQSQSSSWFVVELAIQCKREKNTQLMNMCRCENDDKNNISRHIHEWIRDALDHMRGTHAQNTHREQMMIIQPSALGVLKRVCTSLWLAHHQMHSGNKVRELINHHSMFLSFFFNSNLHLIYCLWKGGDITGYRKWNCLC